MTAELPNLGPEPKKSPLPAVLVTALAVGLVAGGLYWWKTRAPRAPDPVPPAIVAALPSAAPAPSDLPGAAAAPLAGSAQAPVPAAAPSAEQPRPAAATLKSDGHGLKSFTTAIKGPLEGAIVAAVGKDVGQPLTQVVNRSLVWWLAVPGDLLKGDELQVVYEERDNQEPLVHAVRFTSKKFSKTFEAYRFKSKDETFARFYAPSGEELEQRLVDGPLDSWEQVTSLLKDGRRHQGVDFKTAPGSPVKATFDGTITRKTWNFRANGNSLEIAEAAGQGRVAMFLHLSELPRSVLPGQKVKKGEVIARSGNTGHSFAPHLHYQLLRGGKVIDPFESHQTYKKSLDVSEKPKLEQEVARFKGLIGSAQGQVAGSFGRH